MLQHHIHSVPYFELRSLSPGVGYNVFLIAQNAKGRSNSTVRRVYTLKNPEKQTDLSSLAAPAIANMKPFLAIMLGCVGGMMLIAIIIVFIVRMRGSSGQNRGEQYAVNTQRTMQSSQEVGLVRDSCNESAESIEKNPDIIPQGNLLFPLVFLFKFKCHICFIYLFIKCLLCICSSNIQC